MAVQQEVRQRPRLWAEEEKRLSLAGALGAAGIVGPILFTITFITQGIFRPGYSHLAEPVSALAAGPEGWVQDLNFFVFGPLMVIYAIGLHLGIRTSRFGSLGPALLVLSGIGLIIAGAFPARDAGGAFSVGPGHVAGAFMAFVGAGVGLIVISRRMAGDPRWSGLGGYVLASGIAVVVLFLVTGRLAVPDDAPLHQWVGLMQRLALAVWFPCTIVLALRLRRVGNG